MDSGGVEVGCSEVSSRRRAMSHSHRQRSTYAIAGLAAAVAWFLMSRRDLLEARAAAAEVAEKQRGERHCASERARAAAVRTAAARCDGGSMVVQGKAGGRVESCRED